MTAGAPDSSGLFRVSRLTTVSQTGDRDRRAFLSVGRDQDRMFRAARRHSRWVRIVRVVLPASIGIGSVAAYIVLSVFDPWTELERMPTVAGVVVSGTKIMMQQPKLGGYTKDKRPYTVTARTAAQDIKNPDVLELEDIRANIKTLQQGDIELIAHSGVYDGKAENLVLNRNIVITSPSYVARLLEARVAVKSGHVVSERPVEVDMLQGTIRSNRLEVVNSGDVLLFDRGVTLMLEKDDGAAAAPGQKAAMPAQKRAGTR
jgi:lipopolysaccharide export system protein LptC